jgi:hypothetical protein
MYDLIKTMGALFCFILAFFIILIVVKSEEKNEKDN